MNPYSILNISPTNDKMAVRRAYVQETKRHHPDQGGDPEHFQRIQIAYEMIIKGQVREEIVETSVTLNLKDLMYGCNAVALIDIGNCDTLIEFQVPKYSYPGSVIEFHDQHSTNRRIRVTLNEIFAEQYKRLDSNIIIRHKINRFEANVGTELEVENFDGIKHKVKISPETTADRLIYHIDGAGFFDKATKVRGDLTIIVEIKQKGI